MKLGSRIFIFIIAVFTVVSCQKELNIEELGEYSNEIVVNGLLYADSVARINVSRSIGILDKENQDVALKNATVIMTDENDTEHLFQYDSAGYYFLKDDTLKSAAIYRLSVSNDNFPMVNSSVTIPSKTTLLSVDTSITWGVDPNCMGCSGNQVFKVKIKIHGTTTKKEYFVVSLYNIDTVEYYYDYSKGGDVYYNEPRLIKNYSNLYSHNNNLKIVIDNYYIEEVFDDGYYYYGNKLIFEKPEGVTDHSITIYDYNFYMSPYKASMVLAYTAVTEDYYKHQLSLARAEYAEYDFLAEKVSIYTNIENGMGILAGANETRKVIDMSHRLEKETY